MPCIRRSDERRAASGIVTLASARAPAGSARRRTGTAHRPCAPRPCGPCARGNCHRPAPPAARCRPGHRPSCRSSLALSRRLQIVGDESRMESLKLTKASCWSSLSSARSASWIALRRIDPGGEKARGQFADRRIGRLPEMLARRRCSASAGIAQAEHDARHPVLAVELRHRSHNPRRAPILPVRESKTKTRSISTELLGSSRSACWK